VKKIISLLFFEENKRFDCTQNAPHVPLRTFFCQWLIILCLWWHFFCCCWVLLVEYSKCIIFACRNNMVKSFKLQFFYYYILAIDKILQKQHIHTPCTTGRVQCGDNYIIKWFLYLNSKYVYYSELLTRRH
jgi:hypothetical protein